MTNSFQNTRWRHCGNLSLSCGPWSKTSGFAGGGSQPFNHFHAELAVGQICPHLAMLTGKRVKVVRSEQIWLSPVCKERIIVVAFATCKADCWKIISMRAWAIKKSPSSRSRSKPKSSLRQAQLSAGEQCERKAAVRRVWVEQRGNRHCGGEVITQFYQH